MFANSPAPSRELRSVSRIAYVDPVAMHLLGGASRGDGSLGAFAVTRSSGLGIFGIDDALIATAASAIGGMVRGMKNQTVSDPVSAIWKAIPAAAIGARVGSDGWWYSLDDGHRLTHEEAATRQQQITAAVIGATVGADGWWMKDGQQLSHQQAWSMYQQMAGITPTGTTPGAGGGSPVPGTPIRSTPSGTGIAGLSTTTILMVLGGAVLLAVAMKKRGRA